MQLTSRIARGAAVLGGAGALAAFAVLGGGAAASAAATPNATPNAGVINGPFYNQEEAGYQVESSVSFNEVRTTIHIPAGSSSSPFISLQETVNGGLNYSIGLVNIHGEYYLGGIEGIANDSAETGVPLLTNFVFAHFVKLASIGAPFGVPLFAANTGGSYYVEIHYSTKQHLVQFVAGPSETDEATLNTGTTGFLFHGDFNAPAIETLNLQNLFGAGAFLPISTPQSSFTRSGVTEPAGSNVGGIAGTRVTLDFFALNYAEATTHGGTPTIGTNPPTLLASPALPGVGSAFGVITGPAGGGA
jgi:hypothetical protein